VKCLSIRQPHLDALLTGRKEFEYRTWKVSYRGPLLLHAGLRLDGRDVAEEYGYGPDEEFWIGAVLAVCRLVSIRPDGAGLFAWELTDRRELAVPVPLAGRVGLFDVTLTPAQLRLAPRLRCKGA
jgi:hypothetical protein